MRTEQKRPHQTPIAIIGMAGKFPGSTTTDCYWTNLVAGADSVSRLAEKSSESEGVFVPAFGTVPELEEFDAEFFGYTPRDALAIDAQQRSFLECAWQALEDAGCSRAETRRRVGVFAGSSDGQYLLDARAAFHDDAGMTDWQLRLGSGADFLTSRAAYKLGLQGPAVTVQTGCSTSLVALHLAAQSLSTGDCDVALAGGASFTRWTPDRPPESGVVSPDGRCRPFDAAANGTVPACGVGLVVLKRLSDAQRDNDNIRAIVRGTAINNDGAEKASYLSPSSRGHTEVVVEALRRAGLRPDDIGYVEAHGTGTPIGDPIELAGLAEVFVRRSDAHPVYLGSVKGNVGHADAAAGVAGLIKAIHIVESGTIPPTLNFTALNPEIDESGFPFVVNTDVARWPLTHVRRAGVSSLGIGGTNAHVVVEQPPQEPARPCPTINQDGVLLPVSARTSSDLSQACEELAAHLGDDGETDLWAVASTLRTGRHEFAYRTAVVARTIDEGRQRLRAAGTALATEDSSRGRPTPPRVAFMFSGHGGQYHGMGASLATHPAFRHTFEEVSQLAADVAGVDIHDAVFSPGRRPQDDGPIDSMLVGQLSILAVEVALASMWLAEGVRPVAVLGHSLGSYSAAHVAGFLTLPNAVSMVATRARLLETLPKGGMLAVTAPPEDVMGTLPPQCEIAVVNAPDRCVIAVPTADRDEIRAALEARGFTTRPLHIGAAVHSRHVDPILSDFERSLAAMEWGEVRVPWVSDHDGHWTTAAEAARPSFWSAHIRNTIRFDLGIASLVRDARPDVLLEVGPGGALATLARQNPVVPDKVPCLPSLPHAQQNESALFTVQQAAGTLWSLGAGLPRFGAGTGQSYRTVRLPTYPFTHAVFSPAGSGPVETRLDPASVQHGRPQPRAADGDDDVDALFGLVSSCFTRTLGRPVPPDSSIFDLGGDSLTAAQIAQAIRVELDLDVSAADVIRHSRPRDLYDRRVCVTGASGSGVQSSQ
jgi:phthiocerol/phenolphthiocerol synthesis type-I polyketide synthase E